MKTLREAAIGSTVKVVRINGEGAIKRRIMDMGITRGIEIYIRKVAPLGDPVEITVRGYASRKSCCSKAVGVARAMLFSRQLPCKRPSLPNLASPIKKNGSHWN